LFINFRKADNYGFRKEENMKLTSCNYQYFRLERTISTRLHNHSI